MHHATLVNSRRLQRVYELLCNGPKTTREIIREAGVCAVNSIASELRANGIEIDCRCVSGRRGVYEYSLIAGRANHISDLEEEKHERIPKTTRGR